MVLHVMQSPACVLCSYFSSPLLLSDRQVIGVDCSNILDQAKKIIEDNGFADKVTLIKGKMEEIELPVKKVMCG